MKKNRSLVKGTPAQFEGALERRIAELGGDVEACDKITASAETTYQDTNGIMGEIGDTWTVSELRQYWDAEQMNDPVLSEYDSFESWLEDTTRQMTLIEGDEVVSAARDDDDTYDDRFIHTLMGDIESEVSGEVDGLTFDTLENALNVTVVHGGEVTQFTVPHEDLSFDFDKISDDVAYVVDTIRESLDSFSAADDVADTGTELNVSSATNTCGIACKPEVLSSVTGDVIHGLTWSGLIQELSERGYEVDAAYHRSPDQWIQAYKDGKTFDIEVTQYSDGDFEVNPSNIAEVISCDNAVTGSTDEDTSEWYVGDSESGRMYTGRKRAEAAFRQLKRWGLTDAVMLPAEDEGKEWIEVSSKSVTDSDGMLTDYTWYRNQSGDKHIFMFGDKELYEPDESYADWECDSAEEAQEWFDSYNGFDEDDEYDVYGNSQPAVKCDKCGRHLNEMGTCPVCDDGEEDYY